MFYTLLAGHDCCILGPKIIKVVQLFILIQNIHYYPFPICIDTTPTPHLSETSVKCCLVVLVSPSLSFRYLDLEKLRAIIGLMQFPPYSWLEAINTPT